MDEFNRKPAVRLTGIVKRFGDITANNNIDLVAYTGEIHALIGENGAGKTTLMNILAGVYQPDAGGMELYGRPIRFRSPRDAIRAGIGMVHQHFAQVPSCTVAQNIGLSDPDAPFLIDGRSLERRVVELCRTYGFDLDPAAYVSDLSVGERQKLELLRLLSKQADIIILDEPTAVLTPNECIELFGALKELTAKGKAILFITHKLDEVEACADRISVLRKGRIQASGWDRSKWDRKKIISLMVGTEEGGEEIERLVLSHEIQDQVSASTTTLFDLSGGYALGENELQALCDVSLCVRPGEIVAVAGVAGNGQRELAEVALGIRRLQSGVLKRDEEVVTEWGPDAIRRSGVGFVPEDRMSLGICPNLSVMENLNLNRFNASEPFFPSPREMKRRARALADYMEISAPGLASPVRLLSGGNMQRTILAREIDAAKRLLIASQPTRGLDITATRFVRNTLGMMRDRGVGILLISYDLDEIYQLADRIVVMFKGKITERFERPFPDRSAIGAAMTGGKCAEA